MAERNAARPWTMRILFVGLCLGVIFFHLLPLETQPRRWAGPDVIVALCFAWAVRRPEYVPALLIAAMMLLADFIFQRPPGLWAALVVMATEWLKSRDNRQRETTFALEWLRVAVLLLVMTVIYRVTLALMIVSPGTFFLALSQLIMTLVAYPLVVAVSRFALGVTRAAPGDVDRLGRSL